MLVTLLSCFAFLCVFSLPRCAVSTLSWSTFTQTAQASDRLDGPLISVLEPGQMVNVSVWPLIPGWSQPFVRWVKADSFQLWMGSISMLKAIKQMDRAVSEEERRLTRGVTLKTFANWELPLAVTLEPCSALTVTAVLWALKLAVKVVFAALSKIVDWSSVMDRSWVNSLQHYGTKNKDVSLHLNLIYWIPFWDNSTH